MRRVMWLLLAIAVVFDCGAAARAQSAGTMSSGTIRVSASVVVTTIGHNEADGTSTLDVPCSGAEPLDGSQPAILAGSLAGGR